MNTDPSVPSTAITINNQPEVQSEAQATSQTTALQKSGVKGVNGANSETGLSFNPLLPLKPTSSGTGLPSKCFEVSNWGLSLLIVFSNDYFNDDTNNNYCNKQQKTG